MLSAGNSTSMLFAAPENREPSTEGGRFRSLSASADGHPLRARPQAARASPFCDAKWGKTAPPIRSRTSCILSCERLQPLRAFSEAPPPEVLKVRGRTNRRSALPPTLARRPDFAPTAIAPDTSCRSAHPSSAWSGTTREKCCLRQARLQREPTKGSIAGSLSAKSWNMDQPEVPSVSEAFAMRTGGRPWPRLRACSCAFFTTA